MMIMEFNQKGSQQKSSIILGGIKCFFTALLILILASNIAGCSGGDVPPKSDLPSDTPGIATLSYDLIDTNTNIRTTTITKNNPGKIVINLNYNDGTPQVNKVVTVTTTKGTLYPADGLALTDSSGKAVINITAGDDIGVGKISVIVDEVGSANLNFEILADTGPSGTAGGTVFTFDLVDAATGISTTTITKNNPGEVAVKVSDADGNPLVREVVTVTTTKGTLYPADGLALTDSSGKAVINITAGDDIGVGKISVIVDEVGSANLNFEILADTGPSGTAGGTVFTFDLVDAATGISTTTITKNNPGEVAVKVSDADGNPLGREVVTVTTTKGTLYPADGLALTDSSGQAVIGLTANSQIGVGQITVTVDTNKSAPLNFEILADASSGSSSDITSVVTFDLVNSVTDLSTTTISSETPGEIKVNVKNTDGTPQIRKIVTVSTSKGMLYPADGMALTDSAGQAVIVISDNNEIGVGEIIVSVDDVAGDPLYFEIISIETNILPNLLILTTSKTTLLSNNTDSAIITATVLKDNVPLEEVPVKFSSTGGLMSDGSVITDAQGKAEISFTAGPDARNEVVSINASVSGLTDSTPVQITGNKLTLTSDKSNIGKDTDTNIAISLTNAIPLGLANKEITITLEENPLDPGEDLNGNGVLDPGEDLNGNGVLDPDGVLKDFPFPTKLTTDYNGSAQITITGKNLGTAKIIAEGMGARGVLEIEVTPPEDMFEITAPTSIEAGEGLGTDKTVAIVVNVPPLDAKGNPISQVKFHTTLGCFGNGAAGCGDDGTSTKSVVVEVKTDPVTGAAISASATATLGSGEAGTANIIVSVPNDFNTFDNLQIDFFAPPEEAYNITLQASQTVVAPSPGETKNGLTLTATVTTSDDQVVGNAIVDFTISTNPVGGGEQITPASVKTDSSGVATTNFYSGKLSSDGLGIGITAKTTDALGNKIEDTVDIIIGGTAGSIALGLSDKIYSSDDYTYYTVDISAQVTDSNGSPMANQLVTLNLWPTHYRIGYEDALNSQNDHCYAFNDFPQCSGIFDIDNEDR
ncbi:MAG: Ig-like domain-containing protein, partial [Desulfobulbales bacterium]|nr:Ig-like domain-containing protein [Desulfobulbales bacterium]